MKNFARGKRAQLGVIFALGIFAMLLSLVVVATTVMAQTDDATLTVGRSLTIGDITVELSEITETPDGLDIRHTYRTARSDTDAYLIGVPEIRTGEAWVGARKGVRAGDNSLTTNIPWRSEVPGYGEVASVNLGSFVVSTPDISGSAQIALGADYASDIVTEDLSVEIPLNADLRMGSRHYRITKMILVRNPDAADFRDFRLTITPVNEAADKTELAAGGPAAVTLTDNNGNAYAWLGARTRWDNSPTSRTIEWQQLTFEGLPPSATSALTLNIRGGGDVVGPFVFESVRLVSEDIEQTESATPVIPGGSGGPEGPPGSVND